MGFSKDWRLVLTIMTLTLSSTNHFKFTSLTKKRKKVKKKKQNKVSWIWEGISFQQGFKTIKLIKKCYLRGQKAAIQWLLGKYLPMIQFNIQFVKMTSLTQKQQKFNFLTSQHLGKKDPKLLKRQNSLKNQHLNCLCSMRENNNKQD